MGFGGSGWDPGASALESIQNGFINGGIDYFWNQIYADDNDARQRDMSRYNANLQKELSLYAYDLYKKSLVDSPGLKRKGLEAAGFNPILAVNSAAGGSYSGGIPSVGSNISSSQYQSHADSSSHGSSKVNPLLLANAEADLEIKGATAANIRQRTAGEGWQVKTLTRSEAMGLGASIGKALGFNFSDHDQTTFLVAYNPITGELRNLGDTQGGLGTTGASTDAATVRTQFDDDAPVTLHYRRGEDQPYKATYDHTHKFNLPR